MKRWFMSVLAIFLICILLSGPGIKVYAAGDESIFHAMDAYLQEEARKAHLPGMVVYIVDKEKTLLSKTYGNYGSIDECFIIGSNSKSFTAAAIMQLVEQGKVDLDKTINTYIPGAREGDRITVRQLLNHTSGISTYDTFENYKVSERQGESVYANVNYALLGRIIEEVSGDTYSEYMRKHFFEPLGMIHTFTSLDAAKDHGMVDGYRNYFGFMVKEEVAYPDQKINGWLSIPAGYILSSASDMVKYLRFYMDGGRDILKPESIQAMFNEKVNLMPEMSYGFGWCILENLSEPVYYHNGLVENYISYMFILPQSQKAGVILINCNDYLGANGLIDGIFKGVLALLLGDEPQPLQADSYKTSHLVLNAIYLVIVLVGVLPLIFIGRWKKRLLKGRRRVWGLVGFIILHILIPTLLLLVPTLVGVPMAVVKGFVPDLYLLLIGCSAVAYLSGMIKIVYSVIHKKGIMNARSRYSQ